MGKGRSPGKWFRNLLLGKKSSPRPNSSKKNDMIKPSINKDVLASSEASMADLTVDSSPIAPPMSEANGTKGVLSEKEIVSRSSNDRSILSTGDEEDNKQTIANLGSQEDAEKIRLTEAAIKAQAVLRGYQARRTFQKLKAIIQLQALIRGLLVRRQAASALYCVKGIVKFQALVRGYKVRHSDIGLEVLKVCKDTKHSNSIGVATCTQTEKLPESVFVRRLVASMPSAVPLYLYYHTGEPNLVWDWLDRWTRSHFWAPLPESKKKLDSVCNEKLGNSQTVETMEGHIKRKTRKSSAMKVDDGSISDSNKYKRRPTKESNHSLPYALEQPQKKIEKSKKDSHCTLPSVLEQPQKENEKSSLKKTRMQNVSDRSEVVNEKREQGTRKISDHTFFDVSEEGSGASSEKVKELAVSKSKDSDPEKKLGQQAEDERDNKSHNGTVAVLKASVMNGRDEGVQGVSEDLNGADNCISSNCQRRASLPLNFNDQDNELYNTPRLPSYMAPTESAKAKLRGQGSPRFATDLVDKNSITRRHSLSSSLNGKSGSFSPRAERLVAMSSRGVIRTDRSLSSSRDGTDKLIQPQWRR